MSVYRPTLDSWYLENRALAEAWLSYRCYVDTGDVTYGGMSTGWAGISAVTQVNLNTAIHTAYRFTHSDELPVP